VLNCSFKAGGVQLILGGYVRSMFGTIEVVEDQAVAWVACDRLFPKIMSDEIETV